MIELLASLLVGALVAEWWVTYHADEPPPAITAPPPKRTQPVLRTEPVAVTPEVAAAANTAPAPAAATGAATAPAAKTTKATKATPRQSRPPVDNKPAAVTVEPAQPVAAPDAAPAATPAPDVPVRLSAAELAARAAAFAAAGNPLQAAADHAERLARDPQDKAARRALVLALQAGGLPERAIDVAREAPAQFSAAEWAALHADAAGQAVRLAMRGEPRPERQRLLRERAEAALADAWEQADRGQIVAAQDRVTGLRVELLAGTGRHRDAAAAYRSALDAGRTLDDAAHTAAAQSLLATSEVDAADAAYARRSAQAPALPAWESDRLFVRERLDDATAVLERQVAAMPTRLASADGTVNEPSWDRLIAEESRLRALAWRGLLGDAINGQQQLVAQAPGNADLRLQLATFLRYDGKLDRADDEVDKAAALDPQSRGVLVARIGNATEDGDFQNARYHLATLNETWPVDDDGQSLQRDFDLATAPWVEAYVGTTRSRGPGLVTTTDELQQSVAFYGHAWPRRGDTRLFVFEDGAVGEYVGSESSPLRVGAGLSSRHRDWRASIAAHARLGVPDHGTGLTLAGHVRFNDWWEADAGLQTDSTDTPLLALENGIDGWSVDSALQLNVGAGHTYRLEGRRLDLSDDNRALAFSLEGRQPLHADGPHQWSLIERIDTEAHDLTAVPYFSPARMSAAELKLEYRGVLHALGEERREHTLTFGAGASEQTGFGRDGIGDVRWEHAWTLNDRLGLGAGIEWRRRVYDGIDEDQTELFASLLWRLP